MSDIVPLLTEAHKSLLLALVDAEPPEDRGTILAMAMAGREMHVARGSVAVPQWLHQLRYLDKLGLVDAVQTSEYGWTISPLPLGDLVAQELREALGSIWPERVAVLRGARLDGRYKVFGQRVANVLVFMPILGWAVAAVVVGSASLIVPGLPFVLLVQAAIALAVFGVMGRGPWDVAAAARDRAAGSLARFAEQVVEGWG